MGKNDGGRGDDDDDRDDSSFASKAEESLGGRGWLLKLLRACLAGYANVDFKTLRAKYADLTRDQLADKLVSVASHYALVAGGVAGGAATAAEISGLVTGGSSIALGVGAVVADLVYVTRLQMRLVTDVAACYGRTVDLADPEDALMVLYLGVGIAAARNGDSLLQAKGLQATRAALEHTFKEGTRTRWYNNFQEFLGRKVGRRILAQQSKLLIPVVSVALGAGFNYTSTKAMGAVAKNFFSKGLQ